MAGWRRWARLGVLCGLLIWLYFVLPATPRITPQDYLGWGVAAAAFLGGVAYLIVRQLRIQLEGGQDERIDGLVGSMVAVVLAFSYTFFLLEQESPGEVPGLVTRVDALYFVMTTLLTVGYGDIHAEGQTARVLVLVQMVFNVVFIASAASVLSGRVRSVVAARAQARAAPREPPPPEPDG